MAADKAGGAIAGVAVVGGVDLVQGAHDLGRTPSLVDAQVGNNVRSLEAAICVRRRYAAYASVHDDGLARCFSSERCREAVAELRRIAHHEPATVTGVRARECTPVRRRWVAVEVEERLCATEREARPLNEGAVCTEVVRCRDVAAVFVFRNADRDVTANRAVFGLVAGISSDVTASAEVTVVGRAVVDVGARPTPGEVTILTPAVFGADPAANLDAHVGAGDVVEPHTVQAANLHVLDRFGLDGKIGCLRPCYRNESRCRAEEKAFHHLHLEPPNIVS